MFRSDTPKERISDYGAMNTPPVGGKKHRLSRFLSGNQEQEQRPSMTHPDSAYVSSESGQNNIVQVENDGTIPNTNKEQNLALDKGTGEVFDEDTGEVVTVVTTTTTTTTTTTVRGNQRQQHQDVRKDVQTTSTQHPHGAPMSATYNDPGSEAHYVTQPSRDSAHSSGLAPEVPVRSARRSGEYDKSPNYSGEVPTSPTSPSNHNFSYPSRNPPLGTATSSTHNDTAPIKKSGSRFADLKAAAVGLHGVGETLRGTLNSEIDNRYKSKNPEKAAAIEAKNAAVLARGRQEMGGIPHRDHHPVSPITDHDAAYTHQNLGASSQGHTGTLPPDPDSSLPGSASKGSHSAVFGLNPTGERHLDTSPSHTPVPQTTFNDSSVSNLTSSSGNDTLYPPRGTAVRADSATAPETITGNVERVPTLPSQRHHETATTGTPAENPITPAEGGVKKQGTLSKLFKRKLVGGETTAESERKKFY